MRTQHSDDKSQICRIRISHPRGGKGKDMYLCSFCVWVKHVFKCVSVSSRCLTQLLCNTVSTKSLEKTSLLFMRGYKTLKPLMMHDESSTAQIHHGHR